MERRPGRTLTLRATLVVMAAGVCLYAGVLAAYVALEVLPSATRLRTQDIAMAAEYDSVRMRTAFLGAALADLRGLDTRRSRGPGDRAHLDSLGMGLGAAAARASSVRASALLSGISPSMRVSLADAAGVESNVAGVLLEAVADLKQGDFAAAARWTSVADTAWQSLIDRLAEAQRQGLVDMAGRERVLEARLGRVALAAGLWGVAGVALALAGMLWMRWRLFLPLALLDRGMAHVAQGDLEVSLPVERRDELGRLAAHFNEMTGVLRTHPEVEALRASEERLRAAFRTGSDAYVIVSRDDGMILDVNDRFEAMYGYTRGEAVGHTSLALGLWAAPEERDRLLAQLAAAGQVHNLPVQARRKGGETFPVLYSVSALDLDGAALMFGVIRDVTEQQRTQDELRRSEANYRDLVQHAPLGIYRVTQAGRFLMVNPALVRILGYDSAEAVLALDMNTQVYADPADRARFLTEFAAREAAAAETEWMRQDGKRITVRILARWVPGPEGAMDHIEAMVEDVTEQRSLEAQFRQAQRLEAVGRLAGGVAHDFNNALTAIIGFSDLLLAEVPADDARSQDVEEIRKAARRAADITRQLLAFSRKQVLQTEVLDLNDLVNGLLKMLQRLLGEDVRLAFAPGYAVGAVRADPGQLEQVIMNLAVNSRDAMPQGGRLTVETANAELDAAYCREHPDAVPGRFVMLGVTDTGVGMSPEIRSRIFEPFFTTKEVGKGTGLGLATVYGIVKQSGGHIGVYSEPGSGTAFKIYLPRAEQPAAPAPEDAPEPDTPGGAETVLVVEDDSGVREIVTTALTRKGYRVLSAAEGAAAIDLARAHAGEIPLLLTDIVMPGMTGRDIARALTAARPGIRVLYMSGYTDDAVVRHEVLEADTPYLPKPFTTRALAQKVREVLDARRP
jgi:PAS domain S-box-containing protein